MGKSTEGNVVLKGLTNICILKKMRSEQRPEDTMEIAFHAERTAEANALRHLRHQRVPGLVRGHQGEGKSWKGS